MALLSQRLREYKKNATILERTHKYADLVNDIFAINHISRKLIVS